MARDRAAAPVVEIGQASSSRRAGIGRAWAPAPLCARCFRIRRVRIQRLKMQINQQLALIYKAGRGQGVSPPLIRPRRGHQRHTASPAFPAGQAAGPPRTNAHAPQMAFCLQTPGRASRAYCAWGCCGGAVVPGLPALDAEVLAPRHGKCCCGKCP